MYSFESVFFCLVVCLWDSVSLLLYFIVCLLLMGIFNFGYYEQFCECLLHLFWCPYVYFSFQYIPSSRLAGSWGFSPQSKFFPNLMLPVYIHILVHIYIVHTPVQQDLTVLLPHIIKCFWFVSFVCYPALHIRSGISLWFWFFSFPYNVEHFV